MFLLACNGDKLLSESDLFCLGYMRAIAQINDMIEDNRKAASSAKKGFCEAFMMK
jgi:hypothetical protein